MWEVREWVLANTLHHTVVKMKIQFYQIVHFKVLVVVPSSSSIGNGTPSSQRWEPTCIPCVLRSHHLEACNHTTWFIFGLFERILLVSHLMGYCLHLLTVRNLDFMWMWDTSKSYKCANYQAVRTLANKCQLQNSTNAMTFAAIYYCYETLLKLQNFHFLRW